MAILFLHRTLIDGNGGHLADITRLQHGIRMAMQRGIVRRDGLDLVPNVAEG